MRSISTDYSQNPQFFSYMGSSSVLVLIGSHSFCNSFVVNQFLFFSYQMEKIPFVMHPRSNESNMVEKKMFCLFFISKIYSHVTQKCRPKTGMAIPYCLCWKLPDENIQTYLICLQSCNMQKHQKANFRTAEYVCVQQWWLKVSIMHVSWPVTSWNTRSLPTCTRSTMRTGENTVAINNKALSMPRSEHQSCCIIS